MTTSGGQQQYQHHHTSIKGTIPLTSSNPAQAARPSMPTLYGAQQPGHISGAHHSGLSISKLQLDPGKAPNNSIINRNGAMPTNVATTLPSSKPSTTNNSSVISANVFNNNSNSGGAYNEQMFEMQMQMFSSDSNDNSDYGQSSSGQTGAAVNKTASSLFDEFKMEFSDDENDDGNTVDGNKRTVSLTSTLMMNDTASSEKITNNLDSQHQTQPAQRLVPPVGAGNAFSQLSADLSTPQQKTTPAPPAGASNLWVPGSLSDNSTYPPSHHYSLDKLPPALAQHSAIAIAAMATATATVPSIGFIDPSKKLQQQHQLTSAPSTIDHDDSSSHSTRHKEKKKHKEKHKHKDKHKHKHKHKERDREMTLLSSSSPGNGPLKLKISKKKLSCDDQNSSVESSEKVMAPIQPIKLKISLGKPDDQQTLNKKRKTSDVTLPQFAPATKVAKKI